MGEWQREDIAGQVGLRSHNGAGQVEGVTLGAAIKPPALMLRLHNAADARRNHINVV